MFPRWRRGELASESRPGWESVGTARRTLKLRRAVVGCLLVLALTLVGLETALRFAAYLAEDRIEAKRDAATFVGTADVAVYGDSTPFGLGNERSFPTVLAESTNLSIANRSKPGINSNQALVILRDDLARFTPRCVIVMVGVNDVWNLDDVSPDLLPPGQHWQLGLRGLRLWRMARLWWYAGQAFERVKGQGFQRDRAESYKDTDTESISRHGIRGIHAVATEHGGRILFLGYPRHGWNAGADRVERIIDQEFPDDYLRIRDAFADRAWFQRDGFHVTDDGQVLIAKLVEAEMARRGWVQKMPGRGGACMQ